MTREEFNKLPKEKKQILVKRMCDEFDRLFRVASKAQGKKSSEMTKEEIAATNLMRGVFFSK